jgi:hypothetical protein
MPSLYVHAIGQVEPPRQGIHLVWLGPLGFGYAPGGWTIERRDSLHDQPAKPGVCDVLAAQRLTLLRRTLELPTAFGTVRLAEGTWPPDGRPCDAFIWDLEREATIVGSTDAKLSFVYGVRDGKAVGFAGPPAGSFDLGPHPVTQVVLLALGVERIQLCLRGERRWEKGEVIRELQLPLRELMPALTSEQDEFAEAKSRLLDGDAIDEQRFYQLADKLRATLSGLGSRPMDRLLLLRAQDDTEFEELPGTDPLRMLYASPTWRRALGMSYLDEDPALVPGQRYDYRITGRFPADHEDTVFGFHTVPAATPLPAEFYLGGCMVRLPQPTLVGRAPSVDEHGTLVASRRGIPLDPRDSLLPWLDPGLGDVSAVIDLPAATTSLVLELDEGHALEYDAGLPWGGMGGALSVPPGGQARLSFGQPITQLRLHGRGFLFAVRVPAGAQPPPGLVELSTQLVGVKLENTPRPKPPVTATLANLQRPGTTAVNPLGFEVRWMPAVTPGLQFWPAGPVPPPLEATGHQIERRQEPAGAFEPLLPGENLVFGGRDGAPPDEEVRPGADVMAVFPEVPPEHDPVAELSYSDVFQAHRDDPTVRGTPDPGTFHRYRVRTIDIVGRLSDDWTETGAVQLQKHEPPPVPAPPDETPADAIDPPAPTGVFARVLVRGDPGLIPAEQSELGTSDNAIVLEWGWHDTQRALDPFARQFRVYVSPPLDEVAGNLTAVTPVAGQLGFYTVQLALARAVPPDASKGHALNAGHPFHVVGHDGGTTVTATVRTVLRGPDGPFRVPALGPVVLALRFGTELTRPAGWTERVRTLPITAAERYTVVLHDRLDLSPDHPRDTLWVGVSAADDQDYVADSFPGGTLPGNESAVVGALCRARRMLSPELVAPPPLGPVPRFLAPEPVSGSIRFDLDLRPFNGPVPAPGERVVLERVLGDELVAALELDGGHIMATSPGQPDVEFTFAAPQDQAAMMAALPTGNVDAVEDRFLVELAAHHPYRDVLFEAAVEAPVAFGAISQTLPQRPANYLYRLRRADASGRLSTGAAVPKVVVRVPAVTPGATPQRDDRRPGDPATTMRLSVPVDDRLGHLLVFERVRRRDDPVEAAELLRVANRPDLAPLRRVHLRAPGGDLLDLAPHEVEGLPVEDGRRRLELAPAGDPGQQIQVWAATLTRDGVPSALAGPWSVAFPPPDPPAPALTLTSGPTGFSFSWTWADGAVPVQLERSAADGWDRISPVIMPPRTSFETAPGEPGTEYRLRTVFPDGRVSFSATVSA